jgi:Ca2+-binding EF-hand superfamily protein
MLMKKTTLFTLLVISAGAQTAQAQDPERLFSRLDRNGDGLIDRDEIPENLRPRISRLDRDGDGRISREELMAGRDSQNPPEKRPDAGRGKKRTEDPQRSERPNANRFQQLLQRTDKNSNGQLELSELPEPKRQRLEPFDRNGDQAIDAMEFGTAMQTFDPGTDKPSDQMKRERAVQGEGNQQKQGRPDPIARMQNLMKELPKDENGNIDLTALPSEAMGKRLSQFDTNGNQLLEPAELRAMAQKFRQNPGSQSRPEAKPGKKGQPNQNKMERGSERAPQRPKRPGEGDNKSDGRPPSREPGPEAERAGL